MSQFLKNIIARHSGHVSGFVVAPRRRSRFEADQGSMSPPPHHTTEIHHPAPVTHRGPVSGQAGTSLQNQKNGGIHAITTRLREDIIGGETAPAGIQGFESPDPRVGAGPAARLFREQSVIIAPSELSGNGLGPGLGTTRAPGQRIRSILSNEEGTQPQTAERQPEGSNLAGFTEAGSPAALPQTDEAHSEQSESGSAGLAATEKRPGPSNPIKSGLLRTPAWVDELRHGLQNRYRGGDDRKETDTTVNVSIGRIEIRAARDPVTRKPKVKDPAQGVMSLDDYLEKRNGGRK